MNMRKTKKLVTIIVIAISLVVVFKMSGYGDLARLYFTLRNYSNVENFDKYNKDYQLIADKVIKFKDEEKMLEELDLFTVYEGEMNYGSKEIRLSEDEKNSLLNIEKSFFRENFSMDMIRVYDDNYLAFMTMGTGFGVVYSQDGIRPSGLGTIGGEDKQYIIRKLSSNWYTVKEKN